MPGREGQEGEIRISHRVIDQQSQATISGLMEALVELVTNCDDSYRRLESEDIPCTSHISVYVQRKQKGIVPQVIVQDEAEGMTLDWIKEILEFGADSSGFTSGGNIRGLFGKGLKEAIFALGSGQIESVRNGEISVINLWKEERPLAYRWRVEKDRQPSSQSNGTKINIAVSNNNITSSTKDYLREQFQTHFALRDICSTRAIEVTLDDVRLKTTMPMEYTLPQLREVLNERLQLRGFDEMHLRVGESETALDYSRNSPYSIAGIMVKTEGIPLANHAFGFESDEAMHYFSGTMEVPQIAQMLRAGNLGLLSPTRSGIDWRNANAATLQAAIHSQLRPLIDRKRRELESGRRTTTREAYRRKLLDVCDLLNQLADDEIEDSDSHGRLDQLRGLLIRPDVGYALPDEPRRFSIYLPHDVVKSSNNPRVSISIEDIQGDVKPSSTSVTLAPQHSNQEVLTGSFFMQGAALDDSCTIYVEWENEEDMAEFRVREPGKRRQRDPNINAEAYSEK